MSFQDFSVQWLQKISKTFLGLLSSMLNHSFSVLKHQPNCLQGILIKNILLSQKNFHNHGQISPYPKNLQISIKYFSCILIEKKKNIQLISHDMSYACLSLNDDLATKGRQILEESGDLICTHTKQQDRELFKSLQGGYRDLQEEE